MRQQNDIDFTTLNWVKQELDETLKQARQALESYVDDPSDSSLMRFCATYLHQVQGTLRMVELYGAAMVVEEMENLASSILDDKIRNKDDAYAVLMRGIVQLPDYLERLQSGHKDIPIVLLPLLNDLRASRGEKLLSESVLFSPDLNANLPTHIAGPDRPVPELEIKVQAVRLRTRFQIDLLAWIRNASNTQAVQGLVSVLDQLISITSNTDGRRLWWVASGVLEALREGAVENNTTIKSLFGKVDREIKRLADVGDGGFKTSPPRDLIKSLLYYIANAATGNARVNEIKQLYKLDQLLPTEQELEHAKGSLAGRNRALLDTVSVAIKDDLMRVKDALDLHLRSSDTSTTNLAAQIDVLDRVGDTLGMLGLGVPRRVVLEQRDALSDIVSGVKLGDESALLDIAGALLFVEASLDQNIQSLGSEEIVDDNVEVAHELPQAEIRRILEALITESITNIRQIKQDVVAFVESPWDHAKADNVPRLLDEVAGAFTMLEMPQPANYSTALARFTANELIANRRVPTSEQMDRIADSVESLEYYLEAARDQRAGRERILETTKRSLESLGYWPIPEMSANDATLSDVATGFESRSKLELAANHNTLNDSVENSTANEASFELDAFSFGVNIESRKQAFQMDTGAESPISGVQISNENLDQYLGLVGNPNAIFEEPKNASESLEPIRTELPERHEMNAVIDIAPGDGIESLMIGEQLHEAVQPPPPAHNVDGLVFSETESIQTSLSNETEAEFDWVEIEEEVEEWVEAEPAPQMAATTFVEVPSDDIDDEIRETFVEEVGEEIENLNSQFPAWRAHLDDFEKLKPVRRSFHTLKGSGRLVGAKALGEFSWKVENMLNRVLDKSITPTLAVQNLLEKAIGALPQMLTALKGEGAPTAPIAEMMVVAEKLAAGEEAWLQVSNNEPVMRKVIHKRMVQVPRPKRKLEQAVELTETLNVFESLSETKPIDEVVSPVEFESDFEIEEFDSTLMEQNNLSGDIPTIDPVMLEILRSEVETHLQTLRAYLHSCEAQDAIVTLDEDSVRSAHTLHGALAMAEVPGLSAPLGEFESYAKRLRGAGVAPTAQGFDAIARTVALLESSMHSLGDVPLDLIEAEYLSTTFAALSSELPEPASDLQAFGIGFDEDEEIQLIEQQKDVESLVTTTLNPDLILESSSPLEAVDLAEADTPVTGAEVELSSSLDDGNLFEDDNFVGLDEPLQLEEEFLALESDNQQEMAMADIDAVLAGEQATLNQSHDATIEDATSEFDLPLFSATHELNTDLIDPIKNKIDFVSEMDSFDGKLQQPNAAQHIAVQSPLPGALSSTEKTPTTTTVAIAHDSDPDGPLELPDMDEELIEIFVQEGIEILDQADGDVATLRRDPYSVPAINALQRHLHTIKGNARAVGISGVGDLAHVMESLIEGVKEGRLSISGVAQESIEVGFDRLHRMVQRVGRRLSVGMPNNAIARFEMLARGETPELNEVDSNAEQLINQNSIAELSHIESAQQQAKEEIVESPQVPNVSTEIELPINKPAQSFGTAPLARVEEEPVIHAPQEMIRVRSDLLDHLVNFAGEVSIYRSRLEQQMGTFRFNLVELEQTVSRLREQLRKLEIETEAQILSRFQREAQEAGGSAEFDPLELDRFSTLQQLSRALAESVSDLASLQNALEDLTRQSETLLLQQSRVSSELQEGLMRTRMVPFDSLVPMLRRTLRQASVELGKQAQLKVEGAQGEMDRNLLERMKAPFEHMVRNALAHGIEAPDERTRAGKPAEGSVKIEVSRDATEVVIKVSDDGKGMDRDAIRRKAIERGMMRPEAHISDRDLFAFVLETGFSTAEQVTKVAGRGVGMDVVANEIKQLGGSLSIDSKRGQGSEFTIRLPFTLAVTQAILVKTGESIYAVPMSSVQGVARINKDEFIKRIAETDAIFSYAGEDYFIHELTGLLGLPAHRVFDDNQLPMLLTRTGDQRAAIRIDSVIGAREIVVKSVGPQISSVPGIFGATITGDGSVVMILDLAPLVRRSLAVRAEAALDSSIEEFVPVAAPIAMRKPLVMVVDDSITMRKVTTRVLERNEMDVLTAKDGLDAVEKLYDKVPDLVLLDIEMPRMDGYEFATYMRNDARLKHVPIIMITSRTGDKHRQRAFEIGVDRYLGKPYQEADLLRNVEEALRISRAVN